MLILQNIATSSKKCFITSEKTEKVKLLNRRQNLVKQICKTLVIRYCNANDKEKEELNLQLKKVVIS